MWPTTRKRRLHEFCCCLGLSSRASNAAPTRRISMRPSATHADAVVIGADGLPEPYAERIGDVRHVPQFDEYVL